MKKIVSVAVILFFLILFIVYVDDTSKSIVKSINTCINVIIPSTYPYMVLSTYIISGPLYKIIFKPLYLLLKKIIKLDPKSFSIFFISLIGGYPIGLKLLSESIAENKNYYAIASKLAPFCYCISPTFAISMIGFGLYNSAEIGIIIYLSNIIANILAAILFTHLQNLHLHTNIKEQKGDLVKAVNSSSSSLFKMCTIIVFFNAGMTGINSLLKTFGIKIPVVIDSLLEISNILELNNNIDLLPVISMISSFGGICVLFQCFSIVNRTFSFKEFLILRLPIALLSGLITTIIIKYVDISIATATNNHNLQFVSSQNNGVIFMILLMCIVFIQKNEKNLKKG